MASTGSRAGLSNIRKKRVSCTVVLKDELWANCTIGKSDARLPQSIELCLLSIACTVECTRSETECPCGRYGIVRNFCIRAFFATGETLYSRIRALGQNVGSRVGRRYLQCDQ